MVPLLSLVAYRMMHVYMYTRRSLGGWRTAPNHQPTNTNTTIPNRLLDQATPPKNGEQRLWELQPRRLGLCGGRPAVIRGGRRRGLRWCCGWCHKWQGRRVWGKRRSWLWWWRRCRRPGGWGRCVLSLRQRWSLRACYYEINIHPSTSSHTHHTHGSPAIDRRRSSRRSQPCLHLQHRGGRLPPPPAHAAQGPRAAAPTTAAATTPTAAASPIPPRVRLLPAVPVPPLVPLAPIQRRGPQRQRHRQHRLIRPGLVLAPGPALVLLHPPPPRHHRPLAGRGGADGGRARGSGAFDVPALGPLAPLSGPARPAGLSAGGACVCVLFCGGMEADGGGGGPMVGRCVFFAHPNNSIPAHDGHAHTPIRHPPKKTGPRPQHPCRDGRRAVAGGLAPPPRAPAAGRGAVLFFFLSFCGWLGGWVGCWDPEGMWCMCICRCHGPISLHRPPNTPKQAGRHPVGSRAREAFFDAALKRDGARVVIYFHGNAASRCVRFMGFLCVVG